MFPRDDVHRISWFKQSSFISKMTFWLFQSSFPVGLSRNGSRYITFAQLRHSLLATARRPIRSITFPPPWHYFSHSFTCLPRPKDFPAMQTIFFFCFSILAEKMEKRTKMVATNKTHWEIGRLTLSLIRSPRLVSKMNSVQFNDALT